MNFCDNVKIQRTCQIISLWLFFVSLLAGSNSLLFSVLILIAIVYYGKNQRMEGGWERIRKDKEERIRNFHIKSNNEGPVGPTGVSS